MQVLFVARSAFDESPVLAETSAALRARGHRTALLIESQEPALWTLARDLRPDLAVVQASLLAREWAQRTAFRARAVLDVPVALVGSYPTFLPEQSLDSHADVAVVGDAEDTLAELAERLERGDGFRDLPGSASRVEGRAVRNRPRPLRMDLDALPLPDRDLYWARYPGMRAFPWKRFLAGRGCPFSCAYCYQPALRRVYHEPREWVRVKSVARVIEEVRDVAARAPLGHVHFGDDVFGARAEWVEELADRFPSAARVPFSCHLAPELASERTIRALARAGCRALGIGIESGDEQRRRAVLNRRASDQQMIEAAARIRAAGIALVTFNLVGSPGEGPEDVWTTIRFNHRLRTDFARVTLSVALPGTPFGERAVVAAGDGAAHTEREVRNLYHLFGLATAFPWSAPLARRLARLPVAPFAVLGSVVRMWKERATFGVPFLAGLRYFLEFGRPDRRSHAFAALP